MKQLLLHVRPKQTVLALLDNDILSDLAVERAGEEDIVGRVYKGIIRNVVPSLNGMFVDIGIGRNAFLRTRDLISKAIPHTEGSAVLVQVEKDSTQTKGPLVTEKVSFAGKYAVALAGSGYIGISKKITDESKRNLLRRHAKEICPAGMGLIVRTAAEAAGEEEFKRDLASLRRTMEVVEKRYLLEKGPALLYRDGDLAVKSLRDYLTQGVERILVDDREVWKRLSQMAEEEQDMSPDRILFFEERESLFQYFHVDSQIQQLFERVVPLPSGGTLVIDYTEALTVIDVNSGSFKGKGIPHDELAFLINRSAALEIARQIRLRGIGGIIMIDFIDMEKKEEKEKLVHILQAAVREDRVKTVVCGMTSLGLVEMTRKRTTKRLWQYYYDICPCCGGSGHILSAEAAGDRILEDLENRRREGPFKTDLEIRCSADVAKVLLSPFMKKQLDKTAGRGIIIREEPSFSRETYTILSI
ncbi:Rne/Rng family ribonuclease [Dialister sp.]|uniref:Rne/Rng family ribonuclease n=1 Tax=Dialister sp. TaxID=1955814 RepID=UPI003F024C6A